MSIEKMREEFESAWRLRYPDHGEFAFKRSHIEPESYVATRLKDAWWAWQASRAALVIELPYVHGLLSANEAASDQDYYLDQAKIEMQQQCKKAIDVAADRKLTH
ncbi:hypothetical protein [Pseudomonas bohemica]|uniref:hypothetical protein n=1 Tax=Pseudomonas bohemica TaxID=2044872 RepID=UPI0018FE09E0|nr:hypothetical protein [Pseudomonas bohemica]